MVYLGAGWSLGLFWVRRTWKFSDLINIHDGFMWSLTIINEIDHIGTQWLSIIIITVIVILITCHHVHAEWNSWIIIIFINFNYQYPVMPRPGPRYGIAYRNIPLAPLFLHLCSIHVQLYIQVSPCKYMCIYIHTCTCILIHVHVSPCVIMINWYHCITKLLNV